MATVIDSSDNSVHTVEVRRGDTLAKLARNNGTTVETLRRLNGRAVVLHPGISLKYQRSSSRKVIASWDMITTARIATRYNVGDPAYAKKLNYCLDIIRKVPEGVACAA